MTARKILTMNYSDRTSATVQAGRHPRSDRFPVNEKVLRMAEAEYERQFPPGQTIDRIRERGGLGIHEMHSLLACAIERYAPPDALSPRTLTDSVAS